MPSAPVTRAFQTSVEDRDVAAEESREEFDRLDFAMGALDLVQPRRMTVAVCRGHSRLLVQTGRSWGRGEGARWAIVTIPPRASRRAIVLALTELRSAGTGTTAPYALDVLLTNRTVDEA